MLSLSPARVVVGIRENATALEPGETSLPSPAFSLFVSCKDQKDVDYFWENLSGGRPATEAQSRRDLRSSERVGLRSELLDHPEVHARGVARVLTCRGDDEVEHVVGVDRNGFELGCVELDLVAGYRATRK